jgi:hypothetical protein
LDANGKERKLNHFERKNFVNYEPTPMSDDEDSAKGGKDNKTKDTGVVKTIKDGNIIESAAPIVSPVQEIVQEEVVVNNKSKSKPQAVRSAPPKKDDSNKKKDEEAAKSVPKEKEAEKLKKAAQDNINNKSDGYSDDWDMNDGDLFL